MTRLPKSKKEITIDMSKAVRVEIVCETHWWAHLCVLNGNWYAICGSCGAHILSKKVSL